MALRVVLRVLLNDDILNQAELSKDSVIVLVWVDHLALNDHNELVDLEAESFSYFYSYLPHSLTVVHLDTLPDCVRPQDNLDGALLELIILLLHFSLLGLLAFITIEEFREQGDIVAHYIILRRLKFRHAMIYKVLPDLGLHFRENNLSVKFEMKVN